MAVIKLVSATNVKLYVALQVVLEVDNESNYSDLSD